MSTAVTKTTCIILIQGLATTKWLITPFFCIRPIGFFEFAELAFTGNSADAFHDTAYFKICNLDGNLP